MGSMKEPKTAFEQAVSSQRRLEASLTAAGLDPAEFPLMAADVDPLGEPRVQLGAITTTTAGRLSDAIERSVPCTRPADRP